MSFTRALRCLPPLVALLGLALAPAPGLAFDSTSSVVFEDQRYAQRLQITGIPACSGLLDTLYDMQTMRRLTPFVDTIEMLEEQPGAHVVRIGFSILGFHTRLVYERLLFGDDGRIELRLLSHESTFPLVQFPTDFLATYRVSPDGDGVRVDYAQDASMQRSASLPHQLVVRAQVAGFERRLERVLQESCP